MSGLRGGDGAVTVVSPPLAAGCFYADPPLRFIQTLLWRRSSYQTITASMYPAGFLSNNRTLSKKQFAFNVSERCVLKQSYEVCH